MVANSTGPGNARPDKGGYPKVDSAGASSAPAQSRRPVVSLPEIVPDNGASISASSSAEAPRTAARANASYSSNRASAKTTARAGASGSAPVSARSAARASDTAAEAATYGRAHYGSVGRRNASGGSNKRGPWFWVFVISLIVLIGALVALGAIGISYLQGQQKYEKVVETADFNVADVEGKQLKELVIDWDALMNVNSDTVAWVYVPGTNINYPVVQANDNEYYLTRDFDGNQGWLATYGSVFLDFRNSSDFSDMASFIYGHHMQDGSMFSDIAGMTAQDRFDECRTVYLLTPEGNYKLRTFALVHCSASEHIIQTTFSSPGAREDYVQNKIDRSVCSASGIPDASDIKRMFVLATCDNYVTDGRYLLYCYIEETAATDLYGNVGLATENGTVNGLEDSLEMSSNRFKD